MSHTYRQNGDSHEVLYVSANGADVVITHPTKAEAFAEISYLNGGWPPGVAERMHDLIMKALTQ